MAICWSLVATKGPTRLVCEHHCFAAREDYYYGNADAEEIAYDHAADSLLKHGARVNIQVENGDFGSALVVAAASSCRPEEALQLLDRGADSSMRLEHGKYRCPFKAAVLADVGRDVEVTLLAAIIGRLDKVGQGRAALLSRARRRSFDLKIASVLNGYQLDSFREPGPLQRTEARARGPYIEGPLEVVQLCYNWSFRQPRVN